MKYINKNPAPISLEEYKTEPGASFDDMPKHVKDELRENLFVEQGGICCYCGKRIFADYRSVIEHMYPKGLIQFSHLQLEYSNLLCSCDGGQSDRTGKSKVEKRKFPLSCDAKKNNEIIKITPLSPNCEEQFLYDEEGHIYGKTDDAIETIDKLGLDCITLVNKRKAAIEPYIDQNLSIHEWDAKVQNLSNKHSGLFLPFCFAVIYYIKNFKMAAIK